MEQGVWQEIEQLYQKFQKLGISEAVDYDKYYLYSLITHSTAIEGSTLTELDTQLLFDEGVTAKGKPLVYHLMNGDLKQAYELAKAESDRLVPITPAFLKTLNATLMRTTGSVHSVMVALSIPQKENFVYVGYGWCWRTFLYELSESSC